MRPAILLVAKAPIVGEAKTRLGASIGLAAAAEVAAAALLDTLDVCEEALGASRCQLALAGDLDSAVAGRELQQRLATWRVFPQHGESFGERLAHAHATVGQPVIQIGMDTPQVTAAALHEVEQALEAHDAVLGPTVDGGWWVLALREPEHAQALATVPMSTAQTCTATLSALRERGLSVALARTLRDVDEIADAGAVAHEAPSTRFAHCWLAVPR